MTDPPLPDSPGRAGQPQEAGPRPRFEARYLLLVGGAAALVVVAVFAIVSLVAGLRDGRTADEAARVRGEARQLLIELNRVESAQRGFLLSEQPEYRASYEEARAASLAALRALRTRTIPRLRAPVARLADAVEGKLAELALVMELAVHGHRDAALAAMRTGAGRAAMRLSQAELDQLIAALTITEHGNAAQRTRQVTVAVAAIGVGSVVVVVALIGGLVSLRRRILAHQAALAETRRQALELEARQRTIATAAVQLAQANQALARSNRELDQVAYVASHDLKAPLRGIANLAGWLEEDLGDRADAKIHEHLRLLRNRVARLELLIEGILSYARAGQGDAEVSEVDTAAQVRKAIDLLGAPAQVEFTVEPGPWPTLVTDEVQLEQVWLNLLTNAVKYARRADGGGRVVASCHGRRGDLWHFTVADDGPGIPAEFRDRVFEMFQRLQSRDAIEGAGIGLAVVRKLVLAHDGLVWVDDAPTGGAAFHFTWSPTP